MKNTLMKMSLVGIMLALVQMNVARADDNKPLSTPAPQGQGQGLGQGKGIEKRIENQHKRIEHLQEKGKITQEQAADLNKKVDAVADKEKAAKEGGINKEERQELRKELHETGKEIRKARKKGHKPE